MKSLLRAFVLVSCLASPLHAEDWPGWRGPGGMGVTASAKLPLTWGGQDQAHIIWKAPLPGTVIKAKLDHNQSSPIVVRDRVFVLMVYWPQGVAESEFPEHHVACYRAMDGELLWDTQVPPGPWLLKDLRGGYSAPTPCADGERVYALFGSSELAALAFDGSIQWRREIKPFGWDVAVGTSPVLYRDAVLVLADGSPAKHSRLIAFDCRTGNIKWEKERPTIGFSHSTPVLVEVNGRTQLLVSASNALQGLDPANGNLLWWARHRGDVPSPVYGRGVVYSEDGRGGAGIAVDPTGDGDVTESLVKWKSAPIPESYSSPIVFGDYVYRLQNPGILNCRRLSDGEVVAKERLPSGINLTGSPIVTTDGRLYFIGGGISVVLSAGPKMEILAENDLGDPSSASPAVTGDRIFIKGGKHLYCVGTK